MKIANEGLVDFNYYKIHKKSKINFITIEPVSQLASFPNIFSRKNFYLLN